MHLITPLAVAAVPSDAALDESRPRTHPMDGLNISEKLVEGWTASRATGCDAHVEWLKQVMQIDSPTKHLHAHL